MTKRNDLFTFIYLFSKLLFLRHLALRGSRGTEEYKVGRNEIITVTI